MTRLGYQIPNFTYPGVETEDIFGHVIAQAKAAEEAGFDRVLLMDHFYQLPGIGSHDEPMLECYTMLSALAQHTETVRLSALVTGNTYRHPTLLAKSITALDHGIPGTRHAGHRRRLVRARAPLVGLRVRNVHRPVREARGSAPDHHPHAARLRPSASRASTIRSPTPSTRPPPSPASP